MMCLVIIIFTCRSFQRSLEWQTEAKLFTSGNNVCNMNAKVLYNLYSARLSLFLKLLGSLQYRKD